jgi:hypothetical protein
MSDSKTTLARAASAGGRPTVLSDTVREKILLALRMGAFREVACRVAGIHPSTLCRWMQREDEPYASFAREVEEAEAAVEVRASHVLLEGAEKDPILAMRWLERRHKDRWAARNEVTGREGAPVAIQQTHDLTNLSDAQLERLAAGESLATVLAGASPAGTEAPQEG